MQDLRLVGVHEDGRHLLLAADDGTRFRLRLDDALRAAARRDRPRLGQLQIELDGGLRPREVQALVRSGLSAEEVADRAGWSVDKVRRYEGPVLAERDHVADLARAVRMRTHGRVSEESLAARVAHRLTGRGVDAATAVWDAARDAEGQWRVLVLFSAGGRERTATWLFDVPDRTVAAHDDEARWLSEDDADQSGPIPVPHRPTPAAAPTSVYDVESDGGVTGARARRRPQDPIDLVAAMRETSRSRRPRRRVHQPTLTPVEDAPRPDALPLDPVQHDPDGGQLPPAARGVHPLDDTTAQPSDGPPEDPTTAAEPGDRPGRDPVPDSAGTQVDPLATEADAPVGAHDDPEDDVRTDEEVRAAAASDGPTVVPTPPADSDAADQAATVRTSRPAATGRPRRGGRPSVPRWDDIMFGAKGAPTERPDD